LESSPTTAKVAGEPVRIRSGRYTRHGAGLLLFCCERGAGGGGGAGWGGGRLRPRAICGRPGTERHAGQRESGRGAGWPRGGGLKKAAWRVPWAGPRRSRGGKAPGPGPSGIARARPPARGRPAAGKRSGKTTRQPDAWPRRP